MIPLICVYKCIVNCNSSPFPTLGTLTGQNNGSNKSAVISGVSVVAVVTVTVIILLVISILRYRSRVRQASDWKFHSIPTDEPPEMTCLNLAEHPELPEENTFSDDTAEEVVLDANEDSQSTTSPSTTQEPVTGDEVDKPQLLTYELNNDGPGAKESFTEVVPTTHSTGKLLSLLFMHRAWRLM